MLVDKSPCSKCDNLQLRASLFFRQCSGNERKFGKRKKEQLNKRMVMKGRKVPQSKTMSIRRLLCSCLWGGQIVFFDKEQIRMSTAVGFLTFFFILGTCVATFQTSDGIYNESSIFIGLPTFSDNFELTLTLEFVW